jgi:hypothetical protein
VTREERAALRAAIIAGPTDCEMTVEETAVFMGIGVSTLRDKLTDLPKADVAGTKYMKSECIKYTIARLSHRILIAS